MSPALHLPYFYTERRALSPALTRRDWPYGGDLIGPGFAATGRVTAVAADSSHLFVGTANGGLWMSTDSGNTFATLTAQLPTQAVGAIALDPATNPTTIYLGTGEGSGQVGSAYSAALTASGGTPPYTWSVISGSLPAGLTLSAGGTISGTPTSAGASTFTVQVQDSASSPHTAQATLSITIKAPLAITTASLPSGPAGVAYSAALTASGGTPPYTWSVISGSLPAGLTLSVAGTISGTPASAGISTFIVQVQDSATQTASQQFSIVIKSSVQLLYHPRALGFPAEVELGGQGNQSPPRFVFLVNPKGNKKQPGQPVAIETISATPGFNVIGSRGACASGSVLAPGKVCKIAVTFTPTGAGPQTGSLTVAADAANNPSVSLHGVGRQGVLRYAPRAIGFGRVRAGTMSAARPLTLTNPNPAPMQISGIDLTPSARANGFAEQGSCTGSLAPHQSCKVAFTFTPPAKGSYRGQAAINDDAAGSPQTVQLRGVGW